jgi:hypothetical protein
MPDKLNQPIIDYQDAIASLRSSAQCTLDPLSFPCGFAPLNPVS